MKRRINRLDGPVCLSSRPAVVTGKLLAPRLRDRVFCLARSALDSQEECFQSRFRSGRKSGRQDPMRDA
jgi:hypothetical protein